ncbi:restriction endonuclease, partial [Wohlfahrtiimonas chitiniclastica]|uniref:restriction endonuclease subunit S n=1 Tax=Wohlfahrtiimonas chitiniclastica TaxID=400946 RepID=UPI000BC426EE
MMDIKSKFFDEILNCPDVEWLAIDDIASFRRGSFPQPYGNAEWYDDENGMPFIQVADIDENMMLVDNTKRKISQLAQPKSVFVPKGTVIVSLQGSIGRVAITQYDAFIDRTVGIFLSYKKPISVKYFAYQLEKIFLFKSKSARGSTIKTITKEEFADFILPIPPLPIQ